MPKASSKPLANSIHRLNRESEAIKNEVAAANWPTYQPGPKGSLPDKLKGKPEEEIFRFLNRSGEVLFVQHVVKRDDGKSYYPYSYWSDGKWRQMEPDLLPLWGLHQLDGTASTLFLHEGAKAAKYCAWLTTDKSREAREALAAHPWGAFLSTGTHTGYGAVVPPRSASHGLVDAAPYRCEGTVYRAGQ